jgi:hypothetical protein
VNSGQTLLNDSIVFSVINQSYGANMRISKTQADISNTIIFNAQFQNLNDNNIVTQAFTESKSYIGNVSFNHGKGKKGFNLGINLNYSRIATYNNQFEITGPSVSVRKQFKKPKINVNANVGSMVKLKSGDVDGTISTLGTGISYAPHKKHNLALMVNAVRNTTNIISLYTFSEQRISFRYTYSL